MSTKWPNKWTREEDSSSHSLKYLKFTHYQTFFIFWRLKRNLNHSRLEFRITTKQQKQNWNYQRWDIVNIPLQSQPLLTTITFRGIANLGLKTKTKSKNKRIAKGQTLYLVSCVFPKSTRFHGQENTISIPT